MRHHLAAICLFPFAWAGIATAQDLPTDIPDSLNSAETIASAAQSLLDVGMDKILIKDLLGNTLTGTDGNDVGTIENLAVIPGGRIVAALVSTEDGTMIAVPYDAIKVANAAGRVGPNVPVSASELQEMDELRSLAESVAD